MGKAFIDYVHQKIHEGKGYVANYFQENVANDAVRRLRIRATGRNAVHVVIEYAATGKFYFDTYEGTTYSAPGTLPDEINLTVFNRITNRDGMTAEVRHNPTVDELGERRARTVILGGTGPQSTGAGGATRLESVVLPGDDLLLVFTNKSGQAKDLSVTLDWYEEIIEPFTPIGQLFLESLAVEDSEENELTLAPTFDSDVRSYNIATPLEYLNSFVDIDAEADDEIFDDIFIIGDGLRPLIVGENLLNVSLYRNDVNALEIGNYAVTVTRKDTVFLESLSAIADEDELIEFDPLTFSYMATVPNEVDEVVIAAEVDEEEDWTIDAGSDIGTESLEVGENTFTVTVTDDESEKSTAVYTIVIEREAAEED